MELFHRISRQNEILLDLCIGLKAETEALRNIIVQDMVDRGTDAEKIKANYEASLVEARKTILAQIKAHYLMDDGPDDILRSAFPEH